MVGTRLGPYEIEEAIGRGGMGEVYRACDTRLHRRVAIKTLPPAATSDPDRRERFDREARAVAALSHPNIPAIYDVGVHDQIPFLATEWLQGETLRDRLAAGPLPPTDARRFAIEIARALAAAHAHAIVHRDLKPDNVFVTRDGHIKLLDFGIATEPDAPSDETHLAHTAAGVVLGTPGYMSPEQARGQRADARSDIFSFGCVLYEMLSGRRAFAKDSSVETLHAILKEDPADLDSLRAHVPQSLAGIVRQCLQKSPNHRFQTADDLIVALETLGDDARQKGRVEKAFAFPSKRTLFAAVAGLALVVAGGIAWQLAGAPREGGGSTVRVDDRRQLIAVLPFDNISGGDGGAFAAGMTEEISNQLAKLNGLRVISRTAVAQFKGGRADLPRMSPELGVGSIVTGTVRESGGHVRVTVELIEAATGEVVWADRYDRQGLDVFAAQSDIALRVASALNASVSLEEQARIGRRPTSSVAAYELFVRARNVRAATAEARLKESIELLRQAVTLDPRFAEAYSEIATLSYLQAAYGDLTATARGLDAAHKALDIDPQLASAHHGLGMNLTQLGRLREALPALRRAVSLDPSYSTGLNDAGFGETTAGRFDEALKYSLRALQLTPNTATAYYHVGVALLSLDDDVRTERFLTSALTRFPNATRLEALLALLDLRRGHTEAALARTRGAAAKAPNNIEAVLVHAEVSVVAGAPNAPETVAALMQRAPDALFHSLPYPVKLAHAYFLQRSGATRDAAKMFAEILAANQQAITAGADWSMVYMQNAAVRALQGDSPGALDELERAYGGGWRDGRLLALDPLLASLRSEPKFRDVRARIASDVAAMRERADYTGLP
jgi:eukaryotic-like serine/threonine-protein kinase